MLTTEPQDISIEGIALKADEARDQWAHRFGRGLGIGAESFVEKSVPRILGEYPKMPIELTPLQRENVRHALGFDAGGRAKSTSYRNHFVANTGSDDAKSWDDLVSRGLAHHKGPSEISGGGEVYWCTRELALSVREKDEHLSRDFYE